MTKSIFQLFAILFISLGLTNCQERPKQQPIKLKSSLKDTGNQSGVNTDDLHRDSRSDSPANVCYNGQDIASTGCTCNDIGTNKRKMDLEGKCNYEKSNLCGEGDSPKDEYGKALCICSSANEMTVDIGTKTCVKNTCEFDPQQDSVQVMENGSCVTKTREEVLNDRQGLGDIVADFAANKIDDNKGDIFDWLGELFKEDKDNKDDKDNSNSDESEDDDTGNESMDFEVLSPSETTCDNTGGYYKEGVGCECNFGDNYDPNTHKCGADYEIILK